MGILIDLTGQKFGRLFVVERYGKGCKGKDAKWLCLCDCGGMTVSTGKNLRSGNSKSCGCYKRERTSETKRKHGFGIKKERLYLVWVEMRHRCSNSNDTSYKYYGGRGISVCEEWSDYARFREWAFANGYDPYAAYGKCTIDRIDVNGNYEPSNCRWVDMKTQNANKRHKGA